MSGIGAAPVVSVVMPVYNGQPYVAEAVQSVLRQSWRDLELVAVNDGSTDGSLEVLATYAASDPRVRVITKPNGGIVSALNAGIAEARGRWIARMDCDDVSEPQRIAHQMERAAGEDGVVVVGSGCTLIDQRGAVIGAKAYPTGHRDLVNAFARGRYVFPHTSVLVSRGALGKAGVYRERLRNAEDLDLWLRLAAYGRIASVRQPLVRVRKHTTNVSKAGGNEPQQLAALVARIAYYRRRVGAADPAELPDPEWREFIEWVMWRANQWVREECTVAIAASARRSRTQTLASVCRALGPIGASRALARKLLGDRLAERLALQSVKCFRR